MTRRQRLAVATLICLNLALTFAGYFWLAHQANSTRTAQQQAGQLVEAKLCTTLGKLAGLRPPPGDPRANPSRAYLQAQHAALAELGTDLGCKGAS